MTEDQGEEVTVEQIDAVTGDDIMYWLSNQFMPKDLLADKVRYWVTQYAAAEVAKAKAEALREAACAYGPAQITFMGSANEYVRAWMRHRADQIESRLRPEGGN